MLPFPQPWPEPSSLRPQTIIRLYYGVPWDNKYTHVRLYNDVNHRLTSLHSRLFREITEAAPVRMGDYTLSVDFNEMLASQCNYLAFQNAPFDNRWHFAFITAMEPMATEATRIHFELDVFQECIFEINRSTTMFVERSHIPKSQDIAGANTAPESFEMGGYEIYQHQQIPSAADNQEFDIIFATTFDESGNVVDGKMTDQVYNAIEFKRFSTASEANRFITAATNNNLLDGIVDCFMVPHISWAGASRLQIKIPFVRGWFGFTPNNNKLLTYPYCYIYGTNNCGTNVEYRYEWFDDPANIYFYYSLPMSTSPTLIAYPGNYKNRRYNTLESISFSNYPHCAIAIDSYKAWLAQSGSGRVVENLTNMFGLELGETGTGLLQAGVDMVLRNGSGLVTNPLGTILGSLQQHTQAYVQSPGSKNTMGNTVYHSMDLDYISLYQVQIREEYARKIDDFWTMFGYPIGRLEVPNLTSRTFWNYVKTVDCSYKGAVELDMLSKFRQIFDNGVTIWHTDDVGNYSLPNT